MKLDARAALTCHEYFHKIHAPLSFPGLTPDPENAVAEEFKEQGFKHEARVIAALQAAHPSMLIIDPNLPADEAQFDTAAALVNPALTLIAGADIGEITEAELGAKLGQQFANIPRASRPDLLLKVGTSANGLPQWAPIDIKSHGAFKENKSNQIFITPITTLEVDATSPQEGKLQSTDLEQLAHYIRHLQALGLASDELWAGIIGRDIDTAVFMQMGAAINGRGKSATSVLSDHDAAFAVAMDVVMRSREENNNPSAATGIIPQNWSDATFGCPGCPFKSTCLQAMKDFDNGNGHITLLATITPDVAANKLPGITSIRQLRELTPQNDFEIKAQLRAQVWKSKRAQLLDPSTPLDLPEFDIEIDIDLENSMEALRELAPDETPEDDRLYLYGFGVHDRTINPDWHSATIETISDYSNTEQGEYSVMLGMWQRLHEEIARAESSGKSIGIFHYSFHEETWWDNFAKKHAGKPGVPTLAEVDTFIATYMVDLIDYTRKIALPTMGYSIKQVAPWAGFEWTVKDPGGAGSLLKYRDAINPALDQSTRDAAIAWLDSYNRDDVRATFAVRNYIRTLTL